MENGGVESGRSSGSARDSVAAPDSGPSDTPFRVMVERPSLSDELGLEVDLWDGMLLVGAIEPDGRIGRDGRMAAGDQIVALNGSPITTIRELKAVILASLELCFVIVRRAPTVLFSSDAALWMPGASQLADEQWAPVCVRLLSTRVLEVDGRTADGRTEARASTSRSLSVRRADRLRSRGGVVEVSTPDGRLTFRASIHEGRQWQTWLLQCVIGSSRLEVAVSGRAEEVAGGYGGGGGGGGGGASPSSPLRGLASSITCSILSSLGGGGGSPSRRSRCFDAFANGLLLVYPPSTPTAATSDTPPASPLRTGSSGGGLAGFTLTPGASPAQQRTRPPGSTRAQLGQAESAILLRLCRVVPDPARDGAVLLDDTELRTRWRLHSLRVHLLDGDGDGDDDDDGGDDGGERGGGAPSVLERRAEKRATPLEVLEELCQGEPVGPG